MVLFTTRCYTILKKLTGMASLPMDKTMVVPGIVTTQAWLVKSLVEIQVGSDG